MVFKLQSAPFIGDFITVVLQLFPILLLPLQAYSGLSTPPPIPRSNNNNNNICNINNNTNKSNSSNMTFCSNRMMVPRKELPNNTNTGCYDTTKDKWRRLEVSADSIDCQQLVREGTYGRIYSGSLLLTVKASCGNNNNSTTRSTVGIFSTEHHNNNKNINNNYNNDNDEGAETRDVLIKTVLGEWRKDNKEAGRLLLFLLCGY